jgi:hypothetical protein
VAPKKEKKSFFSYVADGWRSGWARGGITREPGFLSRLLDAAGGIRGSKHPDELRETIALRAEVAELWAASPLAGADPDEWVKDLLIEALDSVEVCPASPILFAMDGVVRSLMFEDGLTGVPDPDFSQELTLEEGMTLRRYLYAQRRFLRNYDRYMEVWRRKLVIILAGVMSHFPPEVFWDDEEEGDQAFSVALPDLLVDAPECIERLIVTLDDSDVTETKLFERTREQLLDNLLVASGMPAGARRQDEVKKPFVPPTKQAGLTGGELAATYLSGTPFAELFDVSIPFGIPQAARFEHCHIVAGTGHGKTQTLQAMLARDLEAARRGECSVIVIDSQGDLISTITRLEHFRPQAEASLADRLVLIDPNDIEHPVCLNLFDVGQERIEQYGVVEREKIINGTVSLYSYIFGALLGAELTQRQAVIFEYLARLMFQIPDATIITLLDLLEDGELFRPYMARLSGTSRRFFEREFFDRSFDQNKKQIRARLWGLLSNPTVERMFAHPRNKVDVFEAVNRGSVLLINTAKDLLKAQGCSFLGRFFIALIWQAAIQRAVLPRSGRLPTFVYIDEAHDYFDESVDGLLNQARKFGFGVTLAHQHLEQPSRALLASLMASTSVKLAGGVNDKDARAFAREMRCNEDFIRDMRKRERDTEFACWIKNVTMRPLRLAVPFGVLESMPRLERGDYQALLAMNRARYAATEADTIDMPDVFEAVAEDEAPCYGRAPRDAEVSVDGEEVRPPREGSAGEEREASRGASTRPRPSPSSLDDEDFFE